MTKQTRCLVYLPFFARDNEWQGTDYFLLADDGSGKKSCLYDRTPIFINILDSIL